MDRAVAVTVGVMRTWREGSLDPIAHFSRPPGRAVFACVTSVQLAPDRRAVLAPRGEREI